MKDEVYNYLLEINCKYKDDIVRKAKCNLYNLSTFCINNNISPPAAQNAITELIKEGKLKSNISETVNPFDAYLLTV